MRKRKQILLGMGAVLVAAAIWPIGYIELACGAAAIPPAPYRPLLTDPKDHRPEARTLLTYPEWHIVYSAKSLARHLEARPPSAYPYAGDIGAFWSGFCAVNQRADPQAAGDAKVMLYTIGMSFSAEMIVKGLYENTVGRVFEWIGGWRTPEDRYAQRVQASYGQFMHETPWYRYPFGTAFRQLWTFGPSRVRGAERHLALSLEYGVKALYAKLIGWASGTALGQDERTMRVVLAAQPEQIAAVDPRLRHVTGDTYEAPRYAQFSNIAQKLAAAGIGFREIAGNDDVFLTVVMPKETPGTPLLRMDLADRPGWERRGLLVKVTDLSRTLAALPAGAFEHLYDY